MKKITLIRFLIVFVLLISGVTANHASMTLNPGIYAPEDLTADPEPVTVTSVGTDDLDEDTFRLPTQETFSLEVYELRPGLYRFVNNPESKTDPAALNAEAGGVNLNSITADSGADGVLIRGLGSYPGEIAISFGVINVFPEAPLLSDGNLDVERAAGEIGYQFYTGQNYFDINGAIGVFENISIGDHGNNNTGVIRTRGGGRTFMTDVWVYNVYDGIFFNDTADGYFTNCIFHQSYQPWSHIDDAMADGYFTEEWDTFVMPDGLGDTPFAEGMQSLGVNITEEQYPQIRGVVLRNDATWAYNITLIQNRYDPDFQNVYMKNCTLVKHVIRDTNLTWQHLTGSGAGVYALLEDCMILNLDTSSNTQIRFSTDGPDFVGTIYNTKFWNYAGNDANVQGMDPNWFLFDVDINTPGGLDIGDVSELYRLDGRKLATFKPDSVELTMASDGGQIGYRLPANAPSGLLPVTDGEAVSVSDWPIF